MNYYKEDIEKVETFLNEYDVLKVIQCGDYSEKTFLEDPTNGCRYCKKSNEATRFRNDAHTIPAFLGSRFLLSRDECDDCNELFKQYDDSLSKFLGFYRTASNTKGRSVPKFKDAKSGVSAFIEPDDTLKIILPNLDDIERAQVTKEVELTVNNQPHVPMNVFKSLLKIAFGIMPKEELPNLELTRRFIINDLILDGTQKVSLLKCAMDFIPAPMLIDLPVAIIFKRKNPNSLLPGLMFKLCYKQVTLQILIPFNDEDKHLYERKYNGSIPFSPNVVPIEILSKFGPPQRKIIDLSSLEKSTSTEMKVKFKFDRLEKKNDT